MAWLKQRPAGTLVCWREDGREQSRIFKDPDAAAAFKEQVETNLAALKGAREAERILAKTGGIPGWTDAIPDEDHPLAMQNYLRRLVESDHELRPSSKRTYLVGLRTHIEGTRLGRTRVDAITPDLLRVFWRELKDGHGVRRNIHLLLSKAFNAAINDGTIDVSPLRRSGIRQPSKRRRDDVLPLSVDDIERLADGARDFRDRAAILLMGYGGLRAGEVGGLRAQDVNVETGQVSVRQQVVQIPGSKSITPLKTRAARRTVAIGASVVDELRPLIPLAADDGRLFHGEDGGLWAAVRVNEAVHRAAKAAGLPSSIHSHMLRHAAVSLLIDDGANPKAIQTFVGHSDIRETLQTYGHLFDYGGEALAASMERRRTAYRAATPEATN